ncbi:YncE family protein [Sorangium sp. So ce861]|uniref:YncE family protein n=1 Tax=Sorangium sp. So ce861 TaxID=3133323 RepID=UPI003F5E50C7
MNPQYLSSRLTGALALCAACSSCALVIGAEWDRYSEGAPGAAGAGGATSGAGSAGAPAGEVCTPRATEACYEGSAQTRGVGACRPGTRVCDEEGTSWGPCSGQTLPRDEDCATDADEDCDARACGQASWALAFPANAAAAVATTDAAGNIYLAGSFSDFIDLGGRRLTSSSATDPDLFVAKLDRQGEVVWARQFGETGDIYAPYGIASAGDDGVAFFGLVERFPIDFGGGPITSDRAGSYVVRLDGAGGHVWQQFYADDYLSDLFFDRSGNIVVSSALGSAPEPGHITQIDAKTGATIRSVRTCDEPDGGDCVDEAIRRHIAGGPENTVIALSDDLSTGRRATVRTYDSSLDHRWSVDLTSPDGEVVTSDLASDERGNIYVMGGFRGQLRIGDGDTLFTSIPDHRETFLVKLSPSGEYEWGKSFGDTGQQLDWQMSVSDAGDIAMFGNFSGTVDFGGETLATTTTSDLDLDLVAARLDAGGSHLWSRQFVNSGGQTWPAGVIIDADDTVLIAGSLSRAVVDFGTGALGSAAGDAVFLARIPPP